jgi:hypothetical protein
MAAPEQVEEAPDADSVFAKLKDLKVEGDSAERESAETEAAEAEGAEDEAPKDQTS